MLGRAMVDSFRSGGWQVVSMDLTENPSASTNILVQPDQAMKTQVTGLFAKTHEASKQYDAIICVAGGFGCSSIKDANIFEEYEHQDRINFQTALLAGHFASHMLTPQGFLMLTGAAAVFEGPVNFAYAYAMSKAATHALALSLAQRTEIPESADVCTLLPQVIDTPDNRESMPDADMSEWAPPDKVAQLVRQWAEGENRPMNGSFAKVEYKNLTVFPTFL